MHARATAAESKAHASRALGIACGLALLVAFAALDAPRSQYSAQSDSRLAVIAGLDQRFQAMPPSRAPDSNRSTLFKVHSPLYATNSTSAKFAPYLLPPVTDHASCMSSCIARNKPVLPFRSKCAAESWCANNYKPDAIKDVCTMVCQQFQANCSTARYFIVVGDRPWGLGSDFHARLTAFTYALSTNRVMLYDYSRNRSIWTSPEDENAECRAGNLNCYFEPSTNCRHVPLDWRRHALFFQNEILTPDTYHRQYHAHTLWSLTIDGFGEASPPRFSPSRYHSLRANNNAMRSVLWFKPQLVQFLFRPNHYMLQSTILPLALKTFASHPQAAVRLLPETFISVFIRAGDKGIEVPLHGPHEYWPEVIRLAARFNISDVYISSDSAHVLNVTLHIANAKTPELRMYYIDYPRLESGLNMDYLRHYLWGKPAIRDTINIALTDLFISSHASAWVGTLSSNWCRLQDEMRLGSGRYGVPYHSLDGVYVGLKRVKYDGYSY